MERVIRTQNSEWNGVCFWTKKLLISEFFSDWDHKPKKFDSDEHEPPYGFACYVLVLLMKIKFRPPTSHEEWPSNKGWI